MANAGLAQASVVAGQYRNSDVLRARVDLHRLYTVGAELEPAVDAALGLRGDETIADIGTGPATFPLRLRKGGHRGRLLAVDLNPGMFPNPRPAEIEFIEADASRLPLANASVDALTARHMLYHVPDVPGALGEFRRVLRPGGKFLAVTNARESMATFWDAVAVAAERCPSLKVLTEMRGPMHFSDHNAEGMIRAAFGNARVDWVESRLEVPGAAPLERYFLSCLPGRPIDPEEAFSAFQAALRQRFGERLGKGEPIVISKRLLLVSAVRAG